MNQKEHTKEIQRFKLWYRTHVAPKWDDATIDSFIETDYVDNISQRGVVGRYINIYADLLDCLNYRNVESEPLSVLFLASAKTMTAEEADLFIKELHKGRFDCSFALKNLPISAETLNLLHTSISKLEDDMANVQKEIEDYLKSSRKDVEALRRKLTTECPSDEPMKSAYQEAFALEVKTASDTRVLHIKKIKQPHLYNSNTSHGTLISLWDRISTLIKSYFNKAFRETAQ